MPYDVLLVEDDTRTRERLQRVIAAHADLRVVAAVGSCAEARSMLRRDHFDVLLTDLGLPDGQGTDLIRVALQARPSTRCMVITVFGDERHVLDAIRAGASGYLLKDASAPSICASILDLLAGGAPISPAVAGYLLKLVQGEPAPDPTRTPPGLLEALSARELEVLQLVADGCTYAEISVQLFISINTVGTHIRHIYDKLAVRSRGRAVVEAERHGLLRRLHSAASDS